MLWLKVFYRTAEDECYIIILLQVQEILFLSKLVFNAMLMLVMSLLSLFIFTLLLGNPLYICFQFVGISFLGGIGLSLIFSFLAAIAAKAQQQAALMAIMGFPIVIPQLFCWVKLQRLLSLPFYKLACGKWFYY